MQLLASRSQQLTDLVGKTDAVTGAVAAQSRSLDEALALLPSALTKPTSTFAGLRSTIAVLEPLVAATKPQVKGLTAFVTALNQFARTATPTVAELTTLISSPSGDDLTGLQEAPSLERAAASSFPAIIASLEAQLASGKIQSLREYTPDIVAALANTGQLERLLRRQRPLRPQQAVLRRLWDQRRDAHRPVPGQSLQRAHGRQDRPLSRWRHPAGGQVDARVGAGL